MFESEENDERALEIELQNILTSRRRRRDTDGGRDLKSNKIFQTNPNDYNSGTNNTGNTAQQFNDRTKDCPTSLCDKIINNNNAWLFTNHDLNTIYQTTNHLKMTVSSSTFDVLPIKFSGKK